MAKKSTRRSALKNNRFGERYLLVFVLAFVVIGGTVLLKSFAASPAQPTLNFWSVPASGSTVNWPGKATLYWTSTNTVSCTASGDWSGSQALNNTSGLTQYYSGIQHIVRKFNYTLTCYGPDTGPNPQPQPGGGSSSGNSGGGGGPGGCSPNCTGEQSQLSVKKTVTINVQ